MKYLACLLLTILVGCSTDVPLTRKFPLAPDVMLEKCPKLDVLNNNMKFSEVTKTISENYAKYHGCSDRNDTWIEWYNKQKETFDKVE
jgi:hypothetical protein